MSRKKNKKVVEVNLFTCLLIIAIIAGIVFIFARKTGNNQDKVEENEIENNIVENSNDENIYSNNVINLDQNKITNNWKIVEEQYGSILFYIQGPKKENNDGTYYDIRINMYMSKSELSNEDLKRQMLEDSIYSKIEYTTQKAINSIKWMEFTASKENAKATIFTIMKDGYMYAIEINGEEELYNQYKEEAMQIIETIKISDRIAEDKALETVYKYYNLYDMKDGNTQTLITSLNLQKTMEDIEELPEKYEGYIWTGIKYTDFENEMKKYVTNDVIKNQFDEFVEYKDGLIIKQSTKEQKDYMIQDLVIKEVKGNETTFEVSRVDMNTSEVTKQEITIKFQKNQYLISNVK